MADKTPVRVVFNASNVATGMAEFQTGESVPVANGGTGLTAIGSAGQIIKVNAAGNALEFGAEGDLSITNLVAPTNADLTLTTSGTGNIVLDALTVRGTTISSADSSTININDNVEIDGNLVVTGTVDFNDQNISNVGSLSIDSISGDADTNTSITFSGSDVITIATGGSGRLTIGDGALSPVTDNQIDLGTSSLEFKDAFFDGTVTSDAFAGPLTGDVTGNVSGTAATVTGAAQSNITSLGTLTTLTVDNVIINGTTIGHTSDTDAISIGSDGDITLTQDLELQHDGAILSFGANDDVSLTHVHDTGLLLNSTMKIQFNDASQFIHAPSATVLDIGATDEIELTATLIDIVGNATISGTLGVTGVLTGTSLDISGDIDIDGTTNLDVVDIDGAVDMASTLQVDGAITSSAGATITTADNTDTLTLISTDADAAVGPVLNLKRSSSSPADNDLLGEIKFSGLDSGGGQIVYFRLSGTTLDVTDNTEDGKLVLTQTVASNDVDVLSINETETVFNEGSADKDFRVESNGNTHMLFVDGGNNKVGIGESANAPMGTLHIKSADSGDTAIDVNNDDLVVENDNHAGITISTPNDKAGALYFSDPDATANGRIIYDHSTDAMAFTAENNEAMRFDGNLISTGGETAADVDGGGICLNHGANDNNVLTFKSSDVAHGITGTVETDSYGRILKQSSTSGGLAVVGFSEGQVALMPRGVYTTGDTAKNTGSLAPIFTDARKKSGTGLTDPASNENIFAVTAGFATKFVVDAEGELHSDGGAQSAYDTYEDAHLVRAYDLSHGKGVIDSKFDKFVSYNHEKLADMKLVGREKDGTPNHFINVTGMQRLHNGAIWQQYEKTEKLTQAMYELAKETIGEEKAKKILEKHEVKLLS